MSGGFGGGMVGGFGGSMGGGNVPGMGDISGGGGGAGIMGSLLSGPAASNSFQQYMAEMVSRGI